MSLEEFRQLVIIQCQDTINSVSDKDKLIQKTLNDNFDLIEDRYNQMKSSSRHICNKSDTWSVTASDIALTLYLLW